jgi:tetratricopeptide (TPR) repeat protein
MFHLNLAASYLNQGTLEKAADEAQTTIRTAPRFIQGYLLAAGALIELNRSEEARAVYRQALARGFDTPVIHLALLYLALASGEEGDAELQWFKGRPDEPGPWRERANAAAALGRYGKAADLYRHAQEAADKPLSAERPGRYLQEFAIASALLGSCEKAGLPEGSAGALVKALCGGAPALQTYAATLAQNSGPEAYLRGLALLRAGRYTDAAAIFDQMLTQRLANWGPEYPAAFVGRARTAASAGDTATARKTYEAFFTFWKNADESVPLLRAARHEYAAIR